MSDLKVLVPFLQGMVKEFKEYELEINEKLNTLGDLRVDFSEYVKVIEQQISTANNKFTLSFVGEFKSGKSTIINTLLNLENDEKLSSKDAPDTAKCIRLMYKSSEIDYEAELIFKQGTYENIKTTWEDAKRYTSQVALDKDETLKEKAESIEEVRYFIKNPILETCNILDLPGTGAGGHSHDHTAITDKKIKESDVIFWVVSTMEEPGREAVANLEKFKDKIIPVINVWQHEAGDIKGNCTLEEVKQLLRDNYSLYFAEDVDMVVYYAKEIEYAMENGSEIEDEWGKSDFSNCLNYILDSESFNRELSTTNRIKKNLKDVLKKTDKIIEKHKDEIVELKGDHKELGVDLAGSMSKLTSIKTHAKRKVNDECGHMTNEIIEYLNKQTDYFIEDEMQMTNLRTMIRGINKNKREQVTQEMKVKFEEEYLLLDEAPSWFDERREELIENIKDILSSEYASFAMDSKFALNDDNDLKLNTKFINGVISQSIGAMLEKLGNLLLVVGAAAILTKIPGGAIVDAIAISLLGKSKLNIDTMTKRKDNIKNRAKANVLMQRSSMYNDINDIARKVNDEIYQTIRDRIAKEQSDAENLILEYTDIEEKYKQFQNQISDYNLQLQNL